MPEDTATTRMPDQNQQVILEDRPCNNCGYNLKGLVRGGNCPECGEKIRVSTSVVDDRLGDAPKAYLRVLSLSFLVTGASVMFIFVGVLSIVLDFFFIVGSAVSGGSGPGTTGGAIRGLAFPLGSIGYAVGVFIVARPRPARSGSGFRTERGKPEWFVLRMIARVSAVSMAIGLCASTLAGMTGLNFLNWIAIPLSMVGLMGVLPVTILLANFAHWASDTHIASHVQGAGFFVGTSGLVASLLFTDFAIIAGFFAIPTIMIFGASLFWMGYQTLRMQSMVSWAIRNEKHRIQRDARMAERAKQSAREAAERSGFTGAPSEADPHLLATIERQNAAADATSDIHEGREDDEVPRDQTYLGHKIDSSGAEEYKLEDD